MISKFSLLNFRNYNCHEFLINKKIVLLVGPNGIGKTNLLEGISLFIPGKGLRKAQFKTMSADSNPENGWQLGLTIDDIDILGICQGQNEKRINTINGSLITSNYNFSDFLRVFWLTPEHDQLFLSAPSMQRKFLDRMVYANFPDHLKNLKQYEYATKERLNLLQNYGDDNWLDILEHQIAQAGLLINQARLDLCESLCNIQQENALLPHFTINMEGESENIKEQRFKQILQQNRSLDRQTGITTFGPHRSRVQIIFTRKQQVASLCSSGEQKILLLSWTLAFIRHQINTIPKLMVLLLDDIMNHLDEQHRNILLNQIAAMTQENNLGKLQVWISGTDQQLFHQIKQDGQFITSFSS